MAASTTDQSAALAMVTAADLCCALCRKRTGEVVTKLCHECGLPVHTSCAQHVASRECELEFGFPPPAVYCSRRCYESDLLGQGDEDLSGGAAGKRWSPQVPNELTAALTLKIGDVTRTSRKHLTISTFRFQLSEGFDVFKAKANSRTIKELQSHTIEPFVREDMAIYIRPGVHSKQAELVELSEKNFEARIRKTFRNFLKRKSTQSAAAAGTGAASVRQEAFECDIYTFVKKASVVRRKAGVGGQAPAGRGGGVRMLTGLAAQHHLMHAAHQRLEQNADMMEATSDVDALGVDASIVSSTGTKRRMSELQDRELSAVGGAVTDAVPGYKSIRMVLNGSVVAVKVNIADLVSALGLPSNVVNGQLDMDGADASAASSTNGDC